MNLIVDIGNTCIKAGLFSASELIRKIKFNAQPELVNFINQENPDQIIISSTGKAMDVGNFPENRTLFMSSELSLPFISKYATPQTLGQDRVAAVAGAGSIYPGANILIIDAGTCITYDFLSDDEIYYGGAISAGAEMRFKSMNQFTARLPFLPVPEEWPEITGDSTRSCMESGVMNGIYFEMEGMIAAYKQKYEGLKIILTGGNAHLFEKKFNKTIFAAPDLVLIGLNVILQYNVANS